MRDGIPVSAKKSTRYIIRKIILKTETICVRSQIVRTREDQMKTDYLRVGQIVRAQRRARGCEDHSADGRSGAVSRTENGISRINGRRICACCGKCRALFIGRGIACISKAATPWSRRRR